MDIYEVLWGLFIIAHIISLIFDKDYSGSLAGIIFTIVTGIGIVLQIWKG